VYCEITGTVLLITFSLSVPLSCLGIPLLLLVRLQIYTFGFAACKQELILNTPNSSKENDQENRIPRDHSHFRRYGLSQNGTWCCKTENEVLQNRIFLK
jgi:hypothetical protein